jgi:uncharacterized membrane protein
MTDDRLEQIIGNLLRAGVLLSAAVVAAGGAWYLAANGRAAPAYARFHPASRGVADLARLPLDRGIILAGLLILIATPVARVSFSLVAFALERDRLYVAVTAVVLVILLLSIATPWL